ncbi:MAG TPA: UDP-N-acetylmuramate--L-alanine ligase [Patescibacteria group bacterium]|nr:UDP-N-acetylmuramate--L-alanine ligase [Patescibacteria group bacterium]
MINLKKIKKIHFIGIGGIGISAVARILNDGQHKIIGSDATSSEITEQLEQEGIKILIPQSQDNINSDIELVVYSVAVPVDNIERQSAQKLGINQLTYPQLLGLLLKDRYGIGVSGTDGKTTTTAMISKILIDAGFDPTVVIGSKVDFLGGNSRVGNNKYFIFESDEYQKAFLNYKPQIAAITNILADHLDCYQDLAEIKHTFSQYLKQVPKGGFVVINNDDKNSLDVAKGVKTKIITYGIASQANLMASNIKLENGQQIFDLIHDDVNLGQIKLSIPARYNIYNALCAISVAMAVKIDFKISQKSLAEFTGTWRRWQKLGKVGDSVIITDYAHTPSALSQTISAAKEFYPGQKVLIVFQPHQYNRTKNFFNQFAISFSEADQAIISDIFYVHGREDPQDFDVSSKKLAQAANIEYGGDLEQTEELVRQKINDFNVILIIGAGDIYNLAKKLISNVIDAKVINDDLDDQLDFEDELENQYSDDIERDKSRKPKVVGAGFAKQKQIIEENRNFSGTWKAKVKLVDKTKRSNNKSKF